MKHFVDHVEITLDILTHVYPIRGVIIEFPRGKWQTSVRSRDSRRGNANDKAVLSPFLFLFDERGERERRSTRKENLALQLLFFLQSNYVISRVFLAGVIFITSYPFPLPLVFLSARFEARCGKHSEHSSVENHSSPGSSQDSSISPSKFAAWQVSRKTRLRIGFY